MKPYTYLIGWTQHAKYYYGVRYASNCSPTDLWESYFTSSPAVHEFCKANGAPDIRQVRRAFSSTTEAVNWEHRVLRRMKVHLDDRFLNKHIGGAPPVMFGDSNPSKSPRVRAILSQHLTTNNPMQNASARTRMRTTIQSQYDDGRIPWNKGLVGCFTEDTRTKMSNSHIGKPAWHAGKTNVYTADTLRRMSKAKLGRKLGPLSTSTKTKISVARVGKQWFKSPDNKHCVCCLPQDIPSGYVRGMIKSVKSIPSQKKKPNATN